MVFVVEQLFCDCQGGRADLGTDAPLNLGKGETGKVERPQLPQPQGDNNDGHRSFSPSLSCCLWFLHPAWGLDLCSFVHWGFLLAYWGAGNT